MTPVANVLQTLVIHRQHGTWVFDDDRFGLDREPFVLGMSQIIDAVIAKHCNPGHSSYRVIFSDGAFPNHHGYLEKFDVEMAGAWYTLQDDRDRHIPFDEALKGWLCPATLHYFPEFPKGITIRVEEI